MILLSGADLDRVIRPEAAVDALREAYRALAEHPEEGGRSLGFPIEGGSLHVKAGLLPGSKAVFAAKVNVNLPGNREAHGLPTIQGLVMLSDTRNGRPLAVMDSATLTAIRTAATAALAASYGAPKNLETAALIGCGMQARYLLRTFQALFPIREWRVYDSDARRAAEFVRAAAAEVPECRAASSVREAVEGARIVITCTTSTAPVLTADMELAGAFIAAVGADNPSKQEIDPALMRGARILVDDLEACAGNGDLHHAIEAGVVTRDSVHADLAALAAGRARGRDREAELVIFDSTGSGVQDVAVARAAWQAASAARLGVEIDLG